ncbi:MAG: diaminopimelate epimerase [Gemmatimonadetes bacterium]|nr:diaminopimelate epimerase [Gemmatimonadota bacterium]MYG36029.1 diaminopimelate epimerase [Gemmatimonadota bacterium]
MTRERSKRLRTRPRIGPAFFKAHGHGNDYLVFEEGAGPELTELLARRICDRHRGPGGDGIVVVEKVPGGAEPRLRMFNPDGGEFERSGNGLRIAGVHLRRLEREGDDWFPVTVGGDRVRLRVAGPDATGVWDASVEMGRVAFPDGPPFVSAGRVDARGRVALALPSPLGSEVVLELVPVSVGNPHAVVFGDGWTRADVERYGALIGTADAFPQGTNVQFAETPVQIPEAGAHGELAIRIWERGVGPTLSSGTSACAAVAAAVRSGLLAPGPVMVRMEGGDMEVELRRDWSVRLRGPVEEVCTGKLTPRFAPAPSAPARPRGR